MTIFVDTQVALDAMSQCVAERGASYIYTPVHPGMCVYWHGGPTEGEPGCLVGMALFKLGVPAEVLDECNTFGITTLAEELAFNEIATITTPAIDMFRDAQNWQDKEESWGAVLRDLKARHQEGYYREEEA